MARAIIRELGVVDPQELFALPVSSAKHMSHCKRCGKIIIRVPNVGRGNKGSHWSHPLFSLAADDMTGWIDTCPAKSIEP